MSAAKLQLFRLRRVCIVAERSIVERRSADESGTERSVAERSNWSTGKLHMLRLFRLRMSVPGLRRVCSVAERSALVADTLHVLCMLHLLCPFSLHRSMLRLCRVRVSARIVRFHRRQLRLRRVCSVADSSALVPGTLYWLRLSRMRRSLFRLRRACCVGERSDLVTDKLHMS